MFLPRKFFQARLPQLSTLQYFTQRVGIFPSRLDRTILPGTNALAYFVTVTKKSMRLAPGDVTDKSAGVCGYLRPKL